MMCAHHRIHVESYLKIRGLNSPKPIYILIDEFFTLEIRINFWLTHQYVLQIQEINTIYIDLSLICLVFRKAHPTRGSEFLYVCMCICMYVLINFIISKQDFFRQFHLHTSLIQIISMIFIDQMPTYLVFKKSKFYAVSKFLAACHTVCQSLQMKRQYLKQPLENTYTLFSLWIFCIKMISNTVFEMFLVVYIVKIVYICVFIPSSTSICVCVTLKDPWNVCMQYVHM